MASTGRESRLRDRGVSTPDRSDLSVVTSHPENRGAAESHVAVDFSIVIPCLNEAATIATCVRKSHESLRRLEIEGEVIVADNGSTDGSQELALANGARVVEVPERGYGSAVAAGVAAARGTYVIMGDADDSYDLAHLDPFVAALRAGHDLVIGNRFAGGIEDGAMPFLHRYVGNPLLTLIAKRLFRIPAGDVYCGLRGFRKSAIEDLDLRSSGMEFAIEMVVKSSLQGLDVLEVPTTLSPDGRLREPHLRTWRDGWRSLRFLLLYSPSWLFLYPGAAAILVGTVVSCFLMVRARTIGSVTFDVHTLLYASIAIVIGYQAVIFSMGARIFAIAEGLLPATARWNRLFRIVTLEVGLLVGVVLLGVGLGISLYALVRWEGRSFGPLDYTSTMRLAIPAVTLLALGSETVLGSFFLSILGLKRM
jgi:glycosyltransferase involved in cell wall biosynthesis